MAILNTGGLSGFHLVRRGFQLITSRNRRHFVRGGAPVFSAWRVWSVVWAFSVVSEPLLPVVVVPANGCGGPASDKAGGAAAVVIVLVPVSKDLTDRRP